MGHLVQYLNGQNRWIAVELTSVQLLIQLALSMRRRHSDTNRTSSPVQVTWSGPAYGVRRRLQYLNLRWFFPAFLIFRLASLAPFSSNIFQHPKWILETVLYYTVHILYIHRSAKHCPIVQLPLSTIYVRCVFLLNQLFNPHPIPSHPSNPAISTTFIARPSPCMGAPCSCLLGWVFNVMAKSTCRYVDGGVRCTLGAKSHCAGKNPGY